MPAPFSVPKVSPLPGATPAPGSRPSDCNSAIASGEPLAASRRRVRRWSLGRRLSLYAARRYSGVGIGGRDSMGVPKGVMMDATTCWTAVLTFRRCRLTTSPWLRELLGSWTRWLVWSAKYCEMSGQYSATLISCNDSFAAQSQQAVNLTFPILGSYLLPATLTLTVLSILPVRTTTPTISACF